MMRWGWFAGLLVLLGADAALADVTARFSQPQGPPVIVQVGDRGDSRMTVDEAAYVTRDGVTYMILTGGDGTYVVRQEDFLAVFAELRAQGSRPDPSAAAPRIAIAEQGTETIAGRSGRVFRVGDPDSSDAVEFVISADPELAPVGRVFSAQLVAFFPAGGQPVPGLTEAMSDVLSRGAMIRFGELFRLQSVDLAPVPPSAFDLPSAPISRAALRARIVHGVGR
jgi:hypothetical protein